MDGLELDIEVPAADVEENDDVEQGDLRNVEEEDEEDDESDEYDESGGEGEGEGSGEKWIDVRCLEQMTLEELQQLGLDERGSDANNRRLDPPITKVIVRRLPPTITIEGYLQELSEVPAYDYIRLVPPNEDLPSRIGKRSAIYINFETEQEAFWFKEKYNKMKFFDERGNSYIACVDFSFFQDIAKDPPEPSEPTTGTLEESDVYKEFLTTYEENPWAFSMIRPDTTPTPEVMLEEILNKKIEEPDMTPLLQFLRQRGEKKEAARKERETKRKEKEVARREAKDREREKQRERREKEKERRKERDRERQREREREKRLRKEREKASEGQKRDSKDADKTDQRNKGDKPRDPERSAGQDKDDKDSKQKQQPVNVTYSKAGNVTRWSENSGPRKSGKTRKDDDRKKSQEQLNSATSDALSDKLPVEKGKAMNDNQTSSMKTEEKQKPIFGKPFPVKENVSDKASSLQASTDDRKKDHSERNRNEKTGDNGPLKKKIVKKVIKVKKVVKEDGAGNGSATADGPSHQESSESRPKKIIRVVRKSSKSEDGSSKPSAVIVNKGKDDISEKGAGDAGTNQERKSETEKERKTRKGRPEIQIYRPGSLRGAGASKPSSSSGDKEKDRNDTTLATHSNTESTKSNADAQTS